MASSSIYRKKLLKQILVDFSSESPAIDETRKSNEKTEQLVERLAVDKARAIAQRHDSGLIIGSDQAAECEKEILGKPENYENARQHLIQMSGKTTCFYTGLCVFDAKTESYQSDVIPYEVTFRHLSENEIDNYLFKEQPFHCAGSFKSEKLGICLVSEMKGSDPNALIGLPLIRLCEMLRDKGIKLP